MECKKVVTLQEIINRPKGHKIKTKMKDLEKLLKRKNINDSIIAIDEFVSELCEYGENLENLTEPQKNFFFNQQLEMEVNNGGFSQYFFNSPGDYAHQTVESLKLIGANNVAKILQEAIDKFPNKTVPQDRTERQDVLLDEIEEKNEDVWNELDDKFYEYPDDLSQLNFDYIKQNKEFFA